jgi:RiboL-PSP-HEPN
MWDVASTVVDRLHGEFSGLIAALDKAGEVSLRSTADDNLRKALLLAAASYFEHRMTDAVLSFVFETSNGHALTTSFVRNKAVSRQYHTWFNWEAKNANNFLDCSAMVSVTL